MSSVRILIADDHPLARRALRSTLEKRIEFNVCGEAVNGNEAIQKAGDLNPDVIILDINMPELNGLDAARVIRRIAPNTLILVVSAHDAKPLVDEARTVGVRGFVSKADADQLLPLAIDALTHNQTFFPPARDVSTGPGWSRYQKS
jgi:DNA-binding NarL/FixJ family response regulator